MNDAKKTKAQLIKERDEALRQARIARACFDRDDVQLRAEFSGGRGYMEINERIAGLRILAAQCREILNDPLAVNYVECHLADDLGELVVTVQKKEGKTPNQLKEEAEQERDRLRAEIELVRENAWNLGRASAVP